MSYNNELYKSNLPVTSNSLVEQLSGVRAPPRFVFKGDNNAVMLFFIPHKDPQMKKYKNLIMQHGGIITETEPRETNNILLMSSQPLPFKSSYRMKFIDDCIAAGVVLNIHQYRVPPKESFRDFNKQPKTHNRFDSTKDQYILEQVRRNPRKRNSHAFFDNLAEHEMLSAHSGNSIRSRYRVHLRDKLEYVYKTNVNDELITDENGSLIRVSVDEFPFTLKNRFTAEDDYLLCKEILRYNEEKTDDPKFDPYSQLSVPISFFGDFVRHKAAKSHTVNSWRDRYRKYVFKHGVKKFIDYYDSCIKDNVIPKAISKPNDINSEFRELIGSSYRSKVGMVIDETIDSSALDEEIGQVKSSNIDHALIDQDERRRQVRHQKQLQIQASQPVELKSDILAQSTQSPKAGDESSEDNSQSDIAETNAVVKSVGPIETSQTIEIAQTAQTIQSNQHKSPKIINVENSENSYNDIDSVKKNVDSSQSPKNSQDSQSEQFFDTNDGSEEPEIIIQYAPETTRVSDIFNENFMKYPDSIELVHNLFNLMSTGDSSVDNFFITFKSFGFNEIFTAHVIMCTSGDVVKIKNFVESFVKKIQEIDAPKLSPQEIYKLLRINTMNGVWNEEFDSLLGTRQEKKLLKIHSVNEIDLRKSFLQALH